MTSPKVRLPLYIVSCMADWAWSGACTGVVNNYTGLVLVRFFLGVAEAPFYPGALYSLSIFYTRKEISTGTSILYSGCLDYSFEGLIAAATFESIDGTRGLKGWQF